MSGGRRVRAHVAVGPDRGTPAHRRTVVLVHGWGGHSGHFDAFVEPLVRAGFRVVIPDLPAHGGSAGMTTNAFEMRQALLDLADHVGTPDAVIAHSFGAMVTALALDAGLSPRACAFVAPMTSFNYAVQAFSVALGLSQATRARMLLHLEKQFGISRAGMEVAETASTRSVPLLVVHDEADTRVPLELGRALTEAWPGAQLHATCGLGHQRVLKNAGVIDKLVRFVSSARAPHLDV